MCSLYQIIKKSKIPEEQKLAIPDEQIVVMMYDDIAQNKQ